MNLKTIFVKNHEGVIKRIILKTKDGDYADLVFFKDEESMQRAIELEQISSVCHEFFKLMEENSGEPVVYEELETYEKQRNG